VQIAQTPRTEQLNSAAIHPIHQLVERERLMTRFPPIPVLIVAASAQAACLGQRPPEIAYDDYFPAPALPPAPPPTEGPPRPIHSPPPWTPPRGGNPSFNEARADAGMADEARRMP
jgi:type IV secretion system protein TrbG